MRMIAPQNRIQVPARISRFQSERLSMASLNNSSPWITPGLGNLRGDGHATSTRLPGLPLKSPLEAYANG